MVHRILLTAIGVMVVLLGIDREVVGWVRCFRVKAIVAIGVFQIACAGVYVVHINAIEQNGVVLDILRDIVDNRLFANSPLVFHEERGNIYSVIIRAELDLLGIAEYLPLVFEVRGIGAVWRNRKNILEGSDILRDLPKRVALRDSVNYFIVPIASVLGDDFSVLPLIGQVYL